MKKVLITISMFLLLATACNDNSSEASNANKWDGTYIVSINSNTSEYKITTSDKILSFYDRDFIGTYDNGYFYGTDTTWHFQGLLSDTIKIYQNGTNISGTIISHFRGKGFPDYTNVLPFTGYRK